MKFSYYLETWGYEELACKFIGMFSIGGLKRDKNIWRGFWEFCQILSLPEFKYFGK